VSTINYFEEIDAWKQARELVREVYKATRKDAFSRDFGLINQITRAAVSCMTNIAEGFGRRGNRDFARFLDIAKGSVTEVQSLLYVARDLDYIDDEEFWKMYRMGESSASLIGGFISFLRNNIDHTAEDQQQYGTQNPEPRTQNPELRTQNP